MQVFHWPDDQEFPLKPSVGTLGVFDGVHRGHQRVLERLTARAGELGLPSVVITFDRHPASGVSAAAPPALASLEMKLNRIGQAGVTACVVIRFTPDVAATEAEDFVRQILLRYLGCRAVIVGFDTHFGRQRKGNAALLTRLGACLGFDVIACDPLEVDGEIVSSTRIRQRLAAGDVDGANRLLGYSYTLEGRVVPGDGRGRRLGYPTANLDVAGQLIPGEGVYLAETRIAGRLYPSVASVSRRATFYASDDAPTVVETYLLDFSGDLYGQSCELIFLRRLRDQRRFASAEELRAALAADEAQARGEFRRMGRGGA